MKLKFFIFVALTALLFPCSVAAASAKVNIHLTEGGKCTIKPVYPLYNHKYLGYFSSNPSIKSTSGNVVLTRQPYGNATFNYNPTANLISLSGAVCGYVEYDTIQTKITSLGAETSDLTYVTTIHKKPESISLTGNAVSNNTMYLYSGQAASIVKPVVLPYNAAYIGTDNEYTNAVQGFTAGSVSGNCAEISEVSDGYPKLLSVTPKRSGDAQVKIYPLLFTASTPEGLLGTTIEEMMYEHYAADTSLSETLKIHVRNKPSLSVSIPTQISTNTINVLSAKAQVKGGGDDKKFTWTSSNPSVLTVLGAGAQATLAASSQEGEATVTCVMDDDITQHNPAEKPQTVSLTVKVKKSTISLSGVKNNGTVNFGKKDQLTFDVSEQGSSYFTWTSSNPDVADATMKNGKLVLKRKGAGKSLIVGMSSTGNVFSFTVVADFKPDAPRITAIKNAYGKITFDFSGTLYDRLILELSKNGGKYRVALSTKNKFAALVLSAGSYRARARSLKKVSGKNVYSDYSTPVAFTVSKSGKVKVVKAPDSPRILKARHSKSILRLSLNKVRGLKRYQIQVSVTKNFRKKLLNRRIKIKKKSATVHSKKLRNRKKLYVRVRAIKISGGKSIYGKWSKKRKVQNRR